MYCSLNLKKDLEVCVDKVLLFKVLKKKKKKKNKNYHYA